MSGKDRLRWDEIYRDKPEGVPFPTPDPLLFEFTPLVIGEARALDLAAGLGQNGLWLAAQCYTVDLIDISRVALLRAQAEMGKRGLRNINLYPVDLDNHDLSGTPYQLVCVFRYLNRDLFPKLRNCIAPGGRIIYETFNQRYLQIAPDFNPNYVLNPGELTAHFADWKIIHHLEATHVTQLVAIKP
ncbi:MAG: methyltransferase domain-containing protein [Anaerolineae bacterium]|nr:methyltransferase domain-containing protein [Anaerolineae bacterium]